MLLMYLSLVGYIYSVTFYAKAEPNPLFNEHTQMQFNTESITFPYESYYRRNPMLRC